MAVFKKKRLWIYILFIIVTTVIIGFIIVSKLSRNILIGTWETSDGLRRYTFDENTLTVSSNINSYSEFYGYSFDKNTLILQKNDGVEYYTVSINGSEISISSIDSDSPEILHRVV